tara:strand:- start:872 stop:1108 length:237 start_codon:yes stop_codon:yes gene_type:complete
LIQPKLPKRESLYGESIGCNTHSKNVITKPEDINFDYIKNPTLAARERNKKRFEKINPTIVLAIALMIGVDICLISLK